MKKLLFFLFILCSFSANAQDVYIDYEIGLYAQRFDGVSYLIMKIKIDDNRMLSGAPILKLKTTEGEIIKLEGIIESSETKETTVLNYTSINKHYYVKFEVTQSQIDLLSKGVTKVAINTFPKTFEKEYKKDKVGEKLYQKFMSLDNEL